MDINLPVLNTLAGSKDHSSPVHKLAAVIDGFAISLERDSVYDGIPAKTDDYELVFCLSGSYKRTIGHFVFDVYPHSIHLVSPAYIHSSEQSSEDLLLYRIQFKKEFLTTNFLKENILDNLLDVNPDYPPIYGVSEKSFISIKALYEKIKHESVEENAFHLPLIKLMVMELLYEMNRACEKCLLNSTRHLSRQYQLVNQFKKLVQDRFLNLKTVQEYANLLFVSSKYLTEIVKSETGQNALHVIHNRLFLEAQYLLSSSGLSVKEIAEQLNFDNSSHFSRFFKRFAGVNPSEFKSR
ncbi:helix-turn-helix domain-containing protein [Pedobacter sp. L105]|uniref:AraC family transcriptional regulator n=1 Tax=Pedobacter sp. L105 TaxID=1641871 RepID=UPI00131B0EA4|nr:helix-turn-helix domain-containing protein [Pedobacter sp. L105]